MRARNIATFLLLCCSAALPESSAQSASAPAPTSQPSTQPSTQPATQPERSGEPPGPMARELSVESIQAQIAKLESGAAMDESLRGRLLEVLRQTIVQLNDAASWAASADEFERKRANTPRDLDEARARLQTAQTAASQPATQPADEVDNGLSLDALAARAAEEESLLGQRRTEQNALEDEWRLNVDRHSAIPKRVAEINELLKSLALELNAAEAAGQPAELTLARRDLALARKRALEQELAAYQVELRLHDANSEALTVRRDLARLRVEQGEKRAANWAQALRELRIRSAAREAEAAARALEDAPGPLHEFAEQHRRLAESRAALLEKEDRVVAERRRAETTARELANRLGNARSKVKFAGLSDAVGEILRRERARLPDANELRKQVRSRVKTIADAGIETLDLDDQRETLTGEGAVERLIARIVSDRAIASPELEARIRELHRSQVDLITRYRIDLARYTSELMELNSAQQGLIATTLSVQQYIDENVLWTRSAPPLHETPWPAQVASTLQTVARDTRAVIWQAITDNPALNVLLAALMIALVAVQRRLRRQLDTISEQVHGLHTDSFRLTLEALLITVLIAIPGPALLGLVGWRMLNQIAPPRGPEAVAGAMLRVALVWAVLAFIRQLCRPQGVLQAHLDRRPESLRAFRRHFTWAMAVLLPLGFVLVFCDMFRDDRWRESVGRSTFCVAMIVLMIFLLCVLRPHGAVLDALLRQRREGWLYQLRGFWYTAFAALPVSMLGMAWAGYYYTALMIERRIFLTVGFVLLLFLIDALLVRLLYVAQRRLALKQVRRKRDAEAKARGTDDQAPPAVEPAHAEAETVNVAVISAQTRKLVRTIGGAALLVGAWLIWIDVLPAFNFLKTLTLWSHAVQVPPAAAGGAPSIVQASITLADLGLALVVLALTFVLSRNIPGALEITLLQRLPLERAARYAITSVSRYVIIVVGLIVSFGMIGIGWSEVQWLAAAITVGLGFGLNEIFANFVSGLIILFERPVRVGDTITVGGVTGKVAQIRMRATRVIDWDRREHIIPNRQFISSEVTNWTLTDPSVRLVIEVGVAYGSDVRLVQKLLVQAAEQHASVMQQPRPQAFLVRFAESSMDFQLAAVLRDTADEPRVRHDLLEAVDAALRRAGIEIAFPHRDIRIVGDSAGLASPEREAAEGRGALAE